MHGEASHLPNSPAYGIVFMNRRKGNCLGFSLFRRFHRSRDFLFQPFELRGGSLKVQALDSPRSCFEFHSEVQLNVDGVCHTRQKSETWTFSPETMRWMDHVRRIARSFAVVGVRSVASRVSQGVTALHCCISWMAACQRHDGGAGFKERRPSREISVNTLLVA